MPRQFHTDSAQSCSQPASLSFVAPTLGLVGLYLSSLYNYLLFHSLVEIFSIIVASTIFIVAWNARGFINNPCLLFLGISYLFIGFLDLLHTLSYKGMNIFTDYDFYANQLWIAARYMEAFSLGLAFLLLGRNKKLNIQFVFFSYLATTFVLVGSIFVWKIFPVCFAESTGLTPFKKVSEYLICTLLLANMVLLTAKKRFFEPFIYRLLLWSLIFTIISELAFTFYISNYGFSNLVGHYFKVFSYYLIYKAIISIGIRKPFDLFFRDLSEANRKLKDQVQVRQQAERQLADSRRVLQTVLDTIPVRVFWKDREGCYLGCNQSFARDAGLQSPEEIIGKDDFQLSWRHHAELYKNDDAQVMASGEAKLSYDEPLTTPDGQNRWLSTSRTPFYDEQGTIVGVLGCYQDTTDRKIMEDELQKSQKLDSLGTLAGGIAHDFNNLLTAVMGYTNLARSGLPADHRCRAYLTESEKALHIAKKLTQRIITFSKGGSPVRKPAYISNLVKDSVKLALSGSQVSCDFRISSGLHKVKVDEGQLMQAINNVATNSREAMNDKGYMTVRLENHVQESANGQGAAGVQPGNYVRIEISDQGRGIAEENLPKIFDPYYTTKELRSDKGMGLGLSAAYSIIKKHEGVLFVESVDGQGTTARIYLPALDQREKAAPILSKVTGMPPLRILLMDDEPMVRQVASHVLKEIGCLVDCAEKGEAAVELYRQATTNRTPYDFVILDLSIPGGMGGLETMARLREINVGIKAILSSGYPKDPVMLDYSSHGFTAAIAKPYTPESLIQVLKRLAIDN